MSQPMARPSGILIIATMAAGAVLALAGCGDKNVTTADPTIETSSASPSPSAEPSAEPSFQESPDSGTTVVADPTTAPATATIQVDVEALTEGENKVLLTAFDLSTMTITIDPIEWFTGSAAMDACAEDNETETGSDWCLGWYYRNNNLTTTAAPLVSTATISLAWTYGGTVCEHVVTDPECQYTPPELAKEMSLRAPLLADIQVTNGSVVRITEMYTP